MVCPYRSIMVEFFKFFRSESMLLLSHGGNLWTQQDFTYCADIAYNFEPKNRIKFDSSHNDVTLLLGFSCCNKR
jgi:hypothetical protein